MSGSPAPSPLRFLPPIAVAAALGVAAVGLFQVRAEVSDLRTAAAADRKALQEILAEVTRLRIEQSAGMKGPQALLEKLRTYAPLLTSARTAEPDYRNAQKEMEAVLRAFGALGADAWQPVQDRLAALDPTKDFDEVKQLLRAAVAIDKDKAKALYRDILLGQKLPAPRLRWFVGAELAEIDRPLAQDLLRRVLLTESSRGFNPNHAAAFPGAVVPDPAALSATGFHNYVLAYARTQDPKLDDTLLMVLTRVEHDRMTVQECVKLLGERKYAPATGAIEKLYAQPPHGQEDPIFLNYCLEAIVAIRGADARPFLEAALPKASSELVQQRIQALLGKLAGGAPASSPPARSGETPK
jgi:hypothetical protein